MGDQIFFKKYKGGSEKIKDHGIQMTSPPPDKKWSVP